METPLQLVIGIDGGATYSHGVAATLEGRVLAVVHSASMNFTGSYQKEVRRRMNELVRELELQLPFANEVVRYTVSAAGIFDEATVDQKEKLCGKIYPWKQTRLVGDSVAGFQAATLGKPGVLVICGQGSKSEGSAVFAAVLLLLDVLFKIGATALVELAKCYERHRRRRPRWQPSAQPPVALAQPSAPSTEARATSALAAESTAQEDGESAAPLQMQPPLGASLSARSPEAMEIDRDIPVEAIQ